MLYILCVIAVVIGTFMILKTKARSWIWSILTIPLNIIGLVILFSLKDKSTPNSISQLSSIAEPESHREV